MLALGGDLTQGSGWNIYKWPFHVAVYLHHSLVSERQGWWWGNTPREGESKMEAVTFSNVASEVTQCPFCYSQLGMSH